VKEKEKKRLVIVSGLPGSGKSTLVERLAKKFSLSPVFASSILKALREKSPQKISHKQTEKGAGFWESREGKKFTRERIQKLVFDQALDKKLLEIVRKEKNVVIDSRTLPWLSKKGFKVWLKANEKTRAKRIAQRNGLPWKKVQESMRERLETEKKIYRKLYGFELEKDLEPFHLVLDTTSYNEKEVFEIIARAIQHYFENYSTPTT
jgi:cytidylate kinase